MFKFGNKNFTPQKDGGKKKIFKIFFLSGLILFGIFIHQRAQAAVTYFSPSSGNFIVGNIFTVNVLVNTENVAVNNAEAIINYPSDLLEVVSVNKSGSVFSLWVEEPVFANNVGILSFNGGVPTPGFNGIAGKTLGVTFRVKKAGTASLIFSSAAVRANDGYGTNVFKNGIQATFNLISEEKPTAPPVKEPVKEELPPPPVVGKVPGLLIVSSETHPAENGWYNKNDVKFSWELPAGSNGVSFYFSKSPTSNPGNVSDGILRETEIKDIGEGINYFHIKFRNSVGWGPITHRKVQTDLTPPEDLIVEIVGGEINFDGQPVLTMSAKDELSGVGYFEVSANGGEPVIIPVDSASATHKFDLLLNGDYSILVRAVDKAGNAVEATKSMTVEVPVVPAKEELCAIKIWNFIFDCKNLVVILLIIILILLLLVIYLMARLYKWRDKIEDFYARIRKQMKLRVKIREKKRKEAQIVADLKTLRKLKLQIEQIEKRLKQK